MTTKPSLSFYTNIPTPYQQSFFKELSKLFHLTVVYYSLSESNRSWQFDMQEDYKIVVLKNNFIAKAIQHKIIDFHFSWSILKTVLHDRSQYVIVGGGYWIPNSAAALLIHRLKKKKIAYFSEPLFTTNNQLKHAAKRLLLRTLNSCNALFCIGKKAADSFVQYGVTVPKYVIPYNIDERKFTNLNALQLNVFKQKYNPDNRVIILSSGALIERKGMDILISAVKQLSLNNIRLIIIGDGPEKEKLEQLAEADERIVFAGFQVDGVIPYFFGIADMFAFASRYDGWAVVINEAIAAGVPIISSNMVGASIELLQHKQNGWLCASENVQDFKEGIYTLVTQPQLRQQLQEQAKELIPLISSSYNASYVYQLFTKIIQ